MSWSPLKLRVLILVLLLFAADRLSKQVVETRLPLGRSQQVLGDIVRLTHVRNTGVVFGLWGGGDKRLISAVSLLVLAVLVGYFLRAEADRRLLLLSLGLVLAGAAGNLWDRLLRGYVTDFVDVSLGFTRWPAFNLADAAICVGVAMMALDAFRSRPDQQPAARS
jgi:signal peptidase II